MTIYPQYDETVLPPGLSTLREVGGPFPAGTELVFWIYARSICDGY
jgi:hypothetical protein